MSQNNGNDQEFQSVLSLKAVNEDTFFVRNGGTQHNRPHVLLIPHPSVPHITPMMHLAERLVSQGGICCTILSHDYLVDKVQLAQGEFSGGVHLLGLPKVLSGFSIKPDSWLPYIDSQELAFTTKAYVERLLQQRATGKQDDGPVYTCLIGDITHGWVKDIAAKLKIPRNVFIPAASFVLLTIYDVLVRKKRDEADLKQSIYLPTHPNIPPVGINYITGFLDNEDFNENLRNAVSLADGILINSFYDLETCAIDAIRTTEIKPIPIGPLQSKVQVSKVSFEGDKYVDEECLRWLDLQPANSVVYVNFGTTGFNLFSIEMVHELAFGLEESKARFLWVLRPPPHVKDKDLDHLLPSGFEERVKDYGLISRGWAPQLKILEHPATATFLMQCGWNSLLESTVRGIPFIGWPTFVDQPLNGKYMADVAKVGILLPHVEKKVDRHDVKRAVRTMLFSEEGMLMKKRAEEMKDAADKALKPGGSSHESFEQFVNAIKRT